MTRIGSLHIQVALRRCFFLALGCWRGAQKIRQIGMIREIRSIPKNAVFAAA
jgi:hypothetical protein